jgi:hypothetical protein
MDRLLILFEDCFNMRGLVDDFRTLDWVEVRENLRFTASKLEYLLDIMKE